MSALNHVCLRSLHPSGSKTWRVLLCFGVACTLATGVAGCQSNAAKIAPAEPPVVPVSQPVQREVTDYVEFTGQTKGCPFE